MIQQLWICSVGAEAQYLLVHNINQYPAKNKNGTVLQYVFHIVNLDVLPFISL